MDAKCAVPDEFKTIVMQEVVSLIERYLCVDLFTLSFSIAEEEVLLFAEDVLNDELKDDIERLVSSDPAVANAGDPFNYVFNSYKGLHAILYYRVANHLIYNADILVSADIGDYRDPLDEKETNENEISNYFYLLARQISEEAAIKTSIEINPAARIGGGLVIDHGYKTKIDGDSSKDGQGIVIGETSIIGKNCTILNGVIIGASVVNQGAKNGRRHPQIGTNVTICANARILGGIDIGDNVEIAPFAVVTHDIPSNGKVSIVNQLQIERTNEPEEKIVFYGLIPIENYLLLSGENLLGCSVHICDTDTFSCKIDVNVLEATDNFIKFGIICKEKLPQRVSICVERGNTRAYVLQPNAISAIIGKGDEEDG